MKILISGLGSVGTRHFKNLKALGVKDIIAVDPQKNSLANYNNLEKALSSEKNITAAFICSPSALHLYQAYLCAQKGLHLFIEKPLGTSRQYLDKLIRFVQKKKLITMVGFCYRFHPGILEVKKIIDIGKIGKILLVFVHSGQNLSSFHPGKDYTKEYAAQKNLGGGVVHTSLSHNFDYLRYLLGNWQVLFSNVGKISNLAIDVEDFAHVLLEKNGQTRAIISSNFIQPKKEHLLRIVGELGQIELDFVANVLRIYDARKQKWLEKHLDFATNDMYLDEIKYFLDCLTKKKKATPDIHDGSRTLDYCLEILK